MTVAPDLQPIVDVLKRWASEQPDLRRIWIYGSQALGAATHESDLDVAVEVVTKATETPYDVFVCSAEQWRAELNPRLAPYKLDLKLYDSSAAREKVRHGVDQHGILVYARAT